MHRLHTLSHLRNIVPKLGAALTMNFPSVFLAQNDGFHQNKTLNHLRKNLFSYEGGSDYYNKDPSLTFFPNEGSKNIGPKTTNEEIFGFLNRSGLEFDVKGNGTIRVKYCPLCAKPHNNEKNNMEVLAIMPSSGVFHCFRCGSKGTWNRFKELVSKRGIQPVDSAINQTAYYESYNKKIETASLKKPTLASEVYLYLKRSSLLSNEFPEINRYLTGKGPDDRHLSLQTLEKYKVGVGYEATWDKYGNEIKMPTVYFPMFADKRDRIFESLVYGTQLPEKQQIESAANIEQPTDSSEKRDSESPSMGISDQSYVLSRIKIRGAFKENKFFTHLEPAPGYHGLFGLNTIPPKTKEIVITEGEYDAMAVYEATKMPAISLPHGANSINTAVLPWLEKFEKIYLWMDADKAGQEGAPKIAQKLGAHRVYLVETRRYEPDGPKDANDALRKDPLSLTRYIKEARFLGKRADVVTFSDMKTFVFNKILKFEESCGIKSQEFEWFNKSFKGFRRGEMTIFSGPTGSGKTSFLSHLSLDFAKQGIGTLWGSFEIKNDDLIAKMLHQFSGKDLIKETHLIDQYSENFSKLPLYYLNFFGSNDIQDIIESIRANIDTYAVGHVLIDNLQFLLSGQGKGIEKFDLQDVALAKFRHLATTKNVHVTIVIHPKKVDDHQDLTMNSISGTSKATQEADNVIILQSRPKYRVVDIQKNRFSGDVGKYYVGFDKHTKRYFELKDIEVLTLNRTPDKIDDILRRRNERLPGLPREETLRMTPVPETNEKPSNNQNRPSLPSDHEYLFVETMREALQSSVQKTIEEDEQEREVIDRMTSINLIEEEYDINQLGEEELIRDYEEEKIEDTMNPNEDKESKDFLKNGKGHEKGNGSLYDKMFEEQDKELQVRNTFLEKGEDQSLIESLESLERKRESRYNLGERKRFSIEEQLYQAELENAIHRKNEKKGKKEYIR